MGSTCLQLFAAWKVPLTCRPVLEAMRIPARSCGFYFRCLIVIAEARSHTYYQSGPCPAHLHTWALPGFSASPRTSAWRRIRYEEVQGRCQAMLLCLRGVIGLGHGVDRLLPSRILHYCSQITIEAVDADGAQRLQAVRERRALSGNCNTRQHQLFANGSTRRRQAVQRASRRSPHLSCTPGTRHGIDAAMQSCNHPHA